MATPNYAAAIPLACSMLWHVGQFLVRAILSVIDLGGQHGPGRDPGEPLGFCQLVIAERPRLAAVQVEGTDRLTVGAAAGRTGPERPLPAPGG
jgi:hypothetical protein